MNELGAHFILEHRFDSLEIIGEIRSVYVCFLGYTNDSAYFAILGLIHHNEGLRYISLIEIVYLFGYFRSQILVLKSAAACVGVDHQSCVHDRILVFRKTNYCLLELQAVLDYLITDTIESLDGIYLIGGADTRSQKDMTTVDAFAFLLYELDDVISVLRLDDTRYAFGIIEVKGHICKFAHQLSFSHKAQFTSSFSTLRVFRIESG